VPPARPEPRGDEAGVGLDLTHSTQGRDWVLSTA
jgi:hypothetical protein